MEYRDLNGEEIRVGSFVVYAAALGRSPILKYGLVTSLKRSKGWSPEKPTVGVITAELYRDGWKLQAAGKEITLSFLSRMIVVPDNVVPEGVRAVLVPEFLKRS